MLARENCPYIIALLDVNYDTSNMYLIFEYCQTDAERYLKRQPFTARQRRLFFRQLVLGLRVIHARQCMHRDIKPNNLLLQLRDQDQPSADNDSPTQNDLPDEVLKIADFGLARSTAVRGQVSTNVVSLWYKAPELVLGKQDYGPEIDMWSAGCCLYKFVYGKTLFQVQTELDLLEHIVMIFGSDCVPRTGVYAKLAQFQGYERDLSVFGDDPDLVELFCGLLEVDGTRRWDCARVLACRWLHDVQ